MRIETVFPDGTVSPILYPKDRRRDLQQLLIDYKRISTCCDERVCKILEELIDASKGQS